MIRQVVRDLFLEKIKVITIDIVFEHVSELSVQNLETFNLYDGTEMPQRDVLIWNWGRAKLYNVMNSISFL